MTKKEKNIEDIKKQSEEYLNNWKRAQADFENYKKTESERTGDILRFAIEGIALKLIPIIDNFNLAESHLQEEDKRKEEIKGLFHIKKQIEDLLKEMGVEEIDTIGKFDVNFHEAVETEEGEDKESIKEELQKGYKLNGKVIRPAKVKVIK